MQRVSNFIIDHFPIFIAIYFLIQIVLRLLLTNTAVLDESEQVMLSQYFALGYNAQPPLYTWIQRSVFDIFGTSVFGLTLLKNFLLFLIYLYTYKTGLLLTQDKLKATLGAISLMLLPQIVWGAQIDQTHTVLLTMSSSLFIYYFFKIAVKEATLSDFFIFGIVAGVGLLSKYNFLLVLVGLLSSALIIQEYRKKFLEKRIILSIVVGFMIVLPHFYWFITHLDFATTRTINRMSMDQTGNNLLNTLKGIGKLILSFIAFLSPFWLIFLGFFRKDLHKNISQPSRAILYYIATVFFIIFVMILVTDITNIKERWLQPYLFLSPLLLFMQTHLYRNDKKIMNYISTCVIVAVLVTTGIFARSLLIDVRGRPTRANYPFDKIAQKIKKSIVKQDNILIYAEDKFIGGNFRLFFPKTTVITPSLPYQKYEMKDKILVVWHQNLPKKFLLKLKVDGYTCREDQLKEIYQFSSKLEYRLKYAYCVK